VSIHGFVRRDERLANLTKENPLASGSGPLHVRDASGFQHANDEYYYRPLVSGAELFTYVAHVPAGGVMPPDPEEAKLFELSLFMLDGQLIGTLDTEDMTLEPGCALHIPRGVAFGVRNETDRSASFVLSFAPPPRSGGIDEMLSAAREKGRRVYEPTEFEPIIGEPAFPLR
jgi:quercetin dioxygenase-like cupin family protein